MRFHLFAGSLLLAFYSIIAPAAQPSINGLWEAYYVDTQERSANVEVTEHADGSLTGVIKENFPRPGLKQQTICTACSGDKKDKPFIGMTILSGFKPDPNDPNHWTDGEILDADKGDVYTAEATLSADGKSLDLRGYVLNPLFGKTTTWKRLK